LGHELTRQVEQFENQMVYFDFEFFNLFSLFKFDYR
jgi:hypothetical protein